MQQLYIKRIHTVLGILLMSAIFIAPITYSSITQYASAGSTQEDADSYNLIRLLYKQKIDRIDSFMQEHHKRYNFQGNVLVGYKGNLIYEGSFGFTNPRNQEPLDKEAVFQLASVSKQFTAMAAMIAIEDGLLSYTDTVTDIFPQFPYEGVTIHMLLNHTAGLPNYMWLLEHHWHGKQIPGNKDVIDMLGKHRLPVYFRPGTRFAYSNTGYVVLAAIIEEVSGMRMDQYMEQKIFDPLDMTNTFVHSAAYPEKDTKYLDGYKYWGRRYRRVPNTVNDGTVGDKGVYSTMGDLYKWDQALYENKLVSDTTMQKAFEALQLKNGNHYPYGFGFRLRERDGKKVVYHYGKWNGFRTGIIRYIEDTSTIIILNHTDRPYNSRITRNIQHILGGA